MSGTAYAELETAKGIIGLERTTPEQMPQVRWLRYAELDAPLGLPFKPTVESLAIDSKEDSIHAVALHGKKVVGTLGIANREEWGWYLSRTAVHLDYRHMRIGHELVKFGFILADEAGIDQLALHARPEIPPHFKNTQPFYERLGFMATGDVFSSPDNPQRLYPHMIKDLREAVSEAYTAHHE